MTAKAALWRHRRRADRDRANENAMRRMVLPAPFVNKSHFSGIRDGLPATQGRRWRMRLAA
jgi:hypothetical protein